MQSTARRAESGAIAWASWYRARFLRLYPMYWVAHLVYLLSPFVARLEPVDSRIILSLLGALHRYSDELYVPQRSMVVFLHADPVLLNLSPALLGSAPSWTIALFVNCMRPGIFRALFVARRLATKWIVGAGWFRNLSPPGACARNVAGDVAHSVGRATRMVSSSRSRIRRRLILYPAALLLITALLPTSSSISRRRLLLPGIVPLPDSLSIQRAGQITRAGWPYSTACIGSPTLVIWLGLAFANNRSGVLLIAVATRPCSARGECSWKKRPTRSSTNSFY